MWDGIRDRASAADLKARYGARLVPELDRADSSEIDYAKFRIDDVRLCGATYSAFLHFPSDGRDAVTGVTLARPDTNAKAADDAQCMYREFTSRYGKSTQQSRSASGRTVVYRKGGTWVVLQTDTGRNLSFVHFESAY